eukprot:gnl/MRDRNA2_/MRDRNA2_37881_c0_seq1.p2 gnl/MRDRNA2_/MRDRNA2_37881_c0~~gnl/MRDRNA2_/MRDRNA2_37881_c0_seq1.p2  ORF type:complete len:103 (-),score=9.31 gnl/MRDRNA2_/MRDRNA2_37881_c0_seq1:61-369(-)
MKNVKFLLRKPNPKKTKENIPPWRRLTSCCSLLAPQVCKGIALPDINVSSLLVIDTSVTPQCKKNEGTCEQERQAERVVGNDPLQLKEKKLKRFSQLACSKI